MIWNRRRSFRRKKAQRGLPWHFIYGALAIIVVSALMYGVWYVARLPYFTIVHIEVYGGSTVAPEIVREAAERELTGNYFFLIPKRFTYFYPERQILERVLRIPRVSEASVTRLSKDTVAITFEEHIPHALWCVQNESSSEEVATVSASGEKGAAPECVFLSRDGFAFAPAPALSGSAFTRYITEDRRPEAATQLFDAARMRGVEAFIAALNDELAFRVREVTITKDDDISYALSGGGSILVAGDVSVQESFDNLHSVLESDAFRHLAPGEFEYIDLRFGTRVFVKEEAVPITTEEASVATSSLSETE